MDVAVRGWKREYSEYIRAIKRFQGTRLTRRRPKSSIKGRRISWRSFRNHPPINRAVYRRRRHRMDRSWSLLEHRLPDILPNELETLPLICLSDYELLLTHSCLLSMKLNAISTANNAPSELNSRCIDNLYIREELDCMEGLSFNFGH